MSGWWGKKELSSWFAAWGGRRWCGSSGNLFRKLAAVTSMRSRRFGREMKRAAGRSGGVFDREVGIGDGSHEIFDKVESFGEHEGKETNETNLVVVAICNGRYPEVQQ